MVSVAEQFSSLRDTLGSILGIFTLLRYTRTLIAKLTGRPPPADATSLTPSAFARFTGQPHILPDGTPAPPKPSKKPFLVFMLAAFGLPYLMGKLISALAKSQDEMVQRQQQGMTMGPDGRLLPAPEQQAIDPNNLDFCRLLYDYSPDVSASGGALTPGIDLEVKKGDIVAVLSKSDPMGNPSEWWRCRSRDKRVGYLPAPYLEVIQRRPKEIGAGPAQGSGRASTMSSVGDSRNGTMVGGVGGLGGMGGEKELVGVKAAPGPAVQGKVGDLTVESFQKSQFYS
jgi:peroxin-13